MTTISIRAPKKLIEQIDYVASETDRNKTYHIIKALEFYLAEYADLMIAKDRMNDLTDPVVSLEEVEKTLGLST